MIEIRNEESRDFHRVCEVTTIAFGRDNEARLVERLREVDGYLAFVAVKDRSVVGHVSFSPVTLNGKKSSFLGLAPVSVLPTLQKQGIGSRLVLAGLEHCRDSGMTLVFVLGAPTYYSRFGFRPALQFGISLEYAAKAEHFMVLEIEVGAISDKSGVIRYDPIFADL